MQSGRTYKCYRWGCMDQGCSLPNGDGSTEVAISLLKNCLHFKIAKWRVLVNFLGPYVLFLKLSTRYCMQQGLKAFFVSVKTKGGGNPNPISRA